MAYLETRIIDLKEEENNELCQLKVSSISGDNKMRNIIMMYIEMNMITIKEKRSPQFTKESTGLDMFWFIVCDQGWFRRTIVEMGINEEMSDELLQMIRDGEF